MGASEGCLSSSEVSNASADSVAPKSAEISFRDTFSSPERAAGLHGAPVPCRDLWEITAHWPHGGSPRTSASGNLSSCLALAQTVCRLGAGGNGSTRLLVSAGFPSCVAAEVSLAGMSHPGKFVPTPARDTVKFWLTRGFSRGAAFSSQPLILSLAFRGPLLMQTSPLHFPMRVIYQINETGESDIYSVT